MANIVATITAGDSDLLEVRIAIGENWVARQRDVASGDSVVGNGAAQPDYDWISWVVDGPAGASFEISCAADGIVRWTTSRTIKIGKPFHAGERKI